MSGAGIARFSALVMVVLLAQPAFAQERLATDTPFTVTVDAARYYPDRAQRMEVGGWARLRCVAAADGALNDCVVVGEGPAAFGFAKATLMLSRSMRVRPEVLPTVVGRPGYYKIGFQAPGVSRGVGQDPVKAPKRELVEAARPAGGDEIGMATVSCLAPLTATAPLFDCLSVQEGPIDQGFGAAAVGLAQRYYSAVLKPTPAKVDIWLSAHMFQYKDARGLVPTFNGDGTGLILGPQASAETIAGLPQDSIKLTCGWTDDGVLRDCAADPALTTVSPETLTRALAFTSNLRLVRSVTFNINWGQ